MPNYNLETQVDIVIAMCVVHNFVITHCNNNCFLNKVVGPDWVDDDPKA